VFDKIPNTFFNVESLNIPREKNSEAFNALPESQNVWKEIKSMHHKLEKLEDAVLSPHDRRALQLARKELKLGETTRYDRVVEELL
jgi:hypothetical protein